MEVSKKGCTLNNLKRELAGLFGGLAVLADECIEEGAGKRLLGIEASANFNSVADELNVETTVFGRFLPVWFKYAYEGIQPTGYDRLIHPVGTLVDRLRDFVRIAQPDNSYFDLCLEAAGLEPREQTGFLQDMLERLEARHNLDHGNDLTIEQLALLGGDMNPRSVRNAISADPSLRLNERGEVPNPAARAWLQGRRGFKPTQFPASEDFEEVVPEALDSVEIPVFVAARLKHLWATDGLERAFGSLFIEDGDRPSYIPTYVSSAAEAVGIAPERMREAMELPLRIRPEDTEPIARAIRVDPVWFNLQVMTALFPAQVDMLLNPAAWRAPSEEAPSGPIDACTVELTKAMVEHGYLDLPSWAKTMFPPDCFGERARDARGEEVEFLFGSQRAMSDIRVKSARTISPRRRFQAWYRNELKARPGDQIRVERTGEREYRLVHLAQ